jgi:hypothetical protein
VQVDFQEKRRYGSKARLVAKGFSQILGIDYADVVDISYAASQAHGIVSAALHQEYSSGIIFV